MSTLTANYEFKATYKRTLEIGLGAALLLHLMAIFIYPAQSLAPFELPRELEETRPTKLVDVKVIEIEIIEPDPEPLVPAHVLTNIAIPQEISITDILTDPELNPFADTNPTPSTSASPGFFHAYSDKPVLLSSVEPTYPSIARQAGAEGMVLLELHISETGKVVSVKVLQSNTIKALERAAEEAVLQWLYKPAMQRDLAVPSRVHVQMEFTL